MAGPWDLLRRIVSPSSLLPPFACCFAFVLDLAGYAVSIRLFRLIFRLAFILFTSLYVVSSAVAALVPSCGISAFLLCCSCSGLLVTLMFYVLVFASCFQIAGCLVAV
jgi:hypothetical protein